MTREEAVLMLTRLEKGCDEYAGLTNYAKEAFQMAITALQTDGDCISRQAAIDIFDDYNISVENGELEAYSRDRKRLCNLPSTQPEMLKCEKCRYVYYDKEFGNYWCDRMSDSFKVEAGGYCKWGK